MPTQTAVPAAHLPTLEELDQLRQEYHKKEREARDERVRVETQMLHHPDLPELKPIGTTVIGPCKVTTSESRSWDQSALSITYHSLADAEKPLWPFDVVWKEDKRKRDALKEARPGLFTAIDNALTTKPSKPSFKDIS